MKRVPGSPAESVHCKKQALAHCFPVPVHTNIVQAPEQGSDISSGVKRPRDVREDDVNSFDQVTTCVAQFEDDFEPISVQSFAD